MLLRSDGPWSLKIPVTAGEVILRVGDEYSDGVTGFLALAPNRIVATPSRASVFDVSGGATIGVGAIAPTQGQEVTGHVPHRGVPESYVVDAETGEQVTQLLYDPDRDRPWAIYMLGALPPGDYTIHWAMGTTYTYYADQFDDQVPAEQGVGAADRFTVADSGPDIVFDVTSLIVGGVLTGRVVDPDGVLVPGCRFTATETSGVLAGQIGRAHV